MVRKILTAGLVAGCLTIASAGVANAHDYYRPQHNGHYGNNGYYSGYGNYRGGNCNPGNRGYNGYSNYPSQRVYGYSGYNNGYNGFNNGYNSGYFGGFQSGYNGFSGNVHSAVIVEGAFLDRVLTAVRDSRSGLADRHGSLTAMSCQYPI